jgi:hypothetical protein
LCVLQAAVWAAPKLAEGQPSWLRLAHSKKKLVPG